MVQAVIQPPTPVDLLQVVYCCGEEYRLLQEPRIHGMVA